MILVRYGFQVILIKFFLFYATLARSIPKTTRLLGKIHSRDELIRGHWILPRTELVSRIEVPHLVTGSDHPVSGEGIGTAGAGSGAAGSGRGGSGGAASSGTGIGGAAEADTGGVGGMTQGVDTGGMEPTAAEETPRGGNGNGNEAQSTKDTDDGTKTKTGEGAKEESTLGTVQTIPKDPVSDNADEKILQTQHDLTKSPRIVDDIFPVDSNLPKPAIKPGADASTTETMTCKLRRWLQVRACRDGTVFWGQWYDPSAQDHVKLSYQVRNVNGEYRLSYWSNNVHGGDRGWAPYSTELGGRRRVPHNDEYVHAVGLTDAGGNEIFFIYSENHPWRGVLVDKNDRYVHLPREPPEHTPETTYTTGHRGRASASRYTTGSSYEEASSSRYGGASSRYNYEDESPPIEAAVPAPFISAPVAGAGRAAGLTFRVVKKSDGTMWLRKEGGGYVTKFHTALRVDFQDEVLYGTWLRDNGRLTFFRQSSSEPWKGEIIEFSRKKIVEVLWPLRN